MWNAAAELHNVTEPWQKLGSWGKLKSLAEHAVLPYPAVFGNFTTNTQICEQTSPIWENCHHSFFESNLFSMCKNSCNLAIYAPFLGFERFVNKLTFCNSVQRREDNDPVQVEAWWDCHNHSHHRLQRWDCRVQEHQVPAGQCFEFWNSFLARIR